VVDLNIFELSAKIRWRRKLHQESDARQESVSIHQSLISNSARISRINLLFVPNFYFALRPLRTQYNRRIGRWHGQHEICMPLNLEALKVESLISAQTSITTECLLRRTCPSLQESISIKPLKTPSPSWRRWEISSTRLQSRLRPLSKVPFPLPITKTLLTLARRSQQQPRRRRRRLARLEGGWNVSLHD